MPAEQAKAFHDITPNPECSYRSRHGSSHRAGQDPIAGEYSGLRFDLSRRPGHEHVLQAGVEARRRDQSYLQTRSLVERWEGGKDGGGAPAFDLSIARSQ